MLKYLMRKTFGLIGSIFALAIICYGLLINSPISPFAVGVDPLFINADIVTVRKIKKTFAEAAHLYYEPDLTFFVRISRWILGFPRGPFVIGGREFLGEMVVGCAGRLEKPDADTFEWTWEQCEPLTLSDLAERPASRGAVFGDFGVSIRLQPGEPISDITGSRLGVTLGLVAISLAISILLSYALGLSAALKQHSQLEVALVKLSFILSAMPVFLFAILLVMVFSLLFKSIGLPQLPPGLVVAPRDYSVAWFGVIQAGSWVDKSLHLILPATALTIFSASRMSRVMHAIFLDILRQDYIRTARVKGLHERLVIAGHVVRNAVLLTINCILSFLPGFAGSVLMIEIIFSWRDWGRLFYDALGSDDIPVAIAIFMQATGFVLIAHFLRDVLAWFLDPRIRQASRLPYSTAARNARAKIA